MQAIIHEVIDTDKDDESADIMILDVKPDKKNKGKALENNSGDYGSLQTKVYDLYKLLAGITLC